MSFEFATTRGGDRIVFGANTLGMLHGELAGLDAQRVLVVSSAGRAEIGRRAAAILRDRCVGTLAIAEPHVPAALATFREEST